MSVAQKRHIALEFLRRGELEQAERLYRQILRVDPNHADAHHLLGVIAHQRGRHETAVECIEHAIQIDGSLASYHSNLGAAYRALGRLDSAIACYRKALQIDPKSAGVHYNLANALKDLDRFEAAEASYRRAIDIEPAFAEAHNNLGDALKKQGRLDEAIAHHRRAIDFKPMLAEAHFNLGNALKAQDRLDEAVESYRQALRHKRDYAEAHVNLGYVYDDLASVDRAMFHYDQAILIRPGLAEAHFNRSLLRLRSGDLARGWLEYEWRWEHNGRRRHVDRPEWDGSPLFGRSLFVYAEQGLGDEIMFASCLQEVIEQSEACLVECDSRLIPLFARSFPEAKVIARNRGDAPRFTAGGVGSPSGRCTSPRRQVPAVIGETDADSRLPVTATLEPRIQFDFQIAAGSLPRFLRPDLRSFPRTDAYLRVDPHKLQHWRRRLDGLGPGLKVGISWRGGKDSNVRQKRSTRLDQWEPVLNVPGIHFVNLQYGDCRQELQTVADHSGIVVHDWTDVDPLVELDNFAAQMAALDLVISVDNATVHLAGALGIPVWTLLPFSADWRWLLGRTDSPWYPSMRLIRQRSPDNWTDVFARVGRELELRTLQPSRRSIDRLCGASTVGRQ